MDPLERMTTFVRSLRAAGVPVGIQETIIFGRGCAALNTPQLIDIYWVGRATLIRRPEDVAVFDRCFFQQFAGTPDTPSEGTAEAGPKLAQVGHSLSPWVDPARGDPSKAESGASIASDIELLRHKPFAEMTEEERILAEGLLSEIDVHLPTRKSFRTARSSSGRALHAQRTLRKALRSDGEPGVLVRKKRRQKPRPVFLMLDVSGSMKSHSRALLILGHTMVRRTPRVEIFCFGTRLTRLTQALKRCDVDETLRFASETVPDWGGGTRIADSLETLMQLTAMESKIRGSVMVICSDGLEKGEPEALGRAMRRLSRRVHKVIWVNPLSGDHRYRPIAGGMSAAMPSIDLFESGHDLSSVRSLVARLSKPR